MGRRSSDNPRNTESLNYTKTSTLYFAGFSFYRNAQHFTYYELRQRFSDFSGWTLNSWFFGIRAIPTVIMAPHSPDIWSFQPSTLRGKSHRSLSGLGFVLERILPHSDWNQLNIWISTSELNKKAFIEMIFFEIWNVCCAKYELMVGVGLCCRGWWWKRRRCLNQHHDCRLFIWYTAVISNSDDDDDEDSIFLY